MTTKTKTAKRASKKTAKPSKIVPRPALATKPTKAERVAALVSGKEKPRVEKKAPKGLEIVVDGKEMRRAEVTRLCVSIGNERTFALAKRLGADVTGKTAAVARMLIASAINGKEMPKELALAQEAREAKKAKKAERKPRGESRVDVIATLLRREKGATVNEIAETLLGKFPNVSERWGGGKAELSQYVAFARTAIGHFGAGRLLRGELKGKVAITEEKRDGQGVYKAA